MAHPRRALVTVPTVDAPASIRVVARPDCPACGARGAPLYRDLADAVWGAPGRWTIARCSAPECRTLWLDPAPIEDDLSLAYERYQTHASTAPTPSAGPRRWLERAKLAYLAARWGYPVAAPGRGAALARLAFAVLPQQRARLDSSVSHLRGDRRGRLLDVGCGAGAGLARMRDLGWDAEGVEPDPRAVEVARARGLGVAQGTLHEQGYPEASFDAVTMWHVVEHLHDPRAVLAECLRVLAPGGRLVLETPNAASWLHRRFGQDWRGLEPPRHLQVFTLASLSRLVGSCGFDVTSAFTTAKSAAFFFAASSAARDARRRGVASHDRGLPGAAHAATLAAAAEAGLSWLGAPVGEEIVLRARRPG